MWPLAGGFTDFMKTEIFPFPGIQLAVVLGISFLLLIAPKRQVRRFIDLPEASTVSMDKPATVQPIERGALIQANGSGGTRNRSDDQMIIVNVKGSGSDTETCLQDAMRRAVREAVGEYLDSDLVMLKGRMVKDKVVSLSDGYVAKFDVLSKPQKRPGDGLYEAQIRAAVRKGNFSEASLASQKKTESETTPKDIHASMATRRRAAEQAGLLLHAKLQTLLSDIFSATLESSLPTSLGVNIKSKECTDLLWWVRLDSDFKAWYEQSLPSIHRSLSVIAEEAQSRHPFEKLSAEPCFFDFSSNVGSLKNLILPKRTENPPLSPQEIRRLVGLPCIRITVKAGDRTVIERYRYIGWHANSKIGFSGIDTAQLRSKPHNELPVAVPCIFPYQDRRGVSNFRERFKQLWTLDEESLPDLSPRLFCFKDGEVTPSKIRLDRTVSKSLVPITCSIPTKDLNQVTTVAVQFVRVASFESLEQLNSRSSR
jgi:hypothetical protein